MSRCLSVHYRPRLLSVPAPSSTEKINLVGKTELFMFDLFVYFPSVVSRSVGFVIDYRYINIGRGRRFGASFPHVNQVNYVLGYLLAAYLKGGDGC